jgi:hypothetical protein
MDADNWTSQDVGIEISTGFTLSFRTGCKREFCNVPHFSASLDCRKQGSYQIHVEQSSWQDKSSMSKWKYI